ncbi:hypothetical protein ABZ605_27590 [Streptomyces sp. NPDC012765]|uniref:DUF6197 family protein n=1 Tax=Streptomyces sp. NPDC012765 TaxID=3155249 RepID=UPI0033C327EA
MNTAAHLHQAVDLLERHGLHTGDRFVAPDGALDICAALYLAATGVLPDAFRTDDEAALTLIKASVPAMAAIRAVYNSLGPTVTMPEHDGPDEVIDRVSHWATTALYQHALPPTRTEVIGRLLRTADTLAQQASPLAA